MLCIPRPSIVTLSMMVSTKKVVWILEDDPSTQFIYDDVLGLRYDLMFFSRMANFQAALKEKVPDLAILDLRLPDCSLPQFMAMPEFESIRKVPFFIVSSADDLDVLRLCFEKGAKDYLTKPFGKGELIVRIERYFGVDAKTHFSKMCTEHTLDHTTLTLKNKKGAIQLTGREYQIVNLFLESPDQRVSRQEIFSRVWHQTKVDPKVLDVHLSSLRKKISPLQLGITLTSPSVYALRVE